MASYAPRPYNENAELSLLSSLNRVESPIVGIQIGKYYFGVQVGQTGKFKYPNYVQSITVTKINGQVNVYSCVLKYPITEFDDPNYMEKIFGSISETRRVYFTYGDGSAPTFMYKHEEAIITSITNSFEVMGSCITYTINAVSSADLLKAGYYNFPAITGKPSDEITKLIEDTRYGICDVLPGMLNYKYSIVEDWIDKDDADVRIEAKTNISILDYLNYLVSCMRPIDSNDKSVYSVVIVDDTQNKYKYDGAYFMVKKVDRDTKIDDISTYELDIGYPSNNLVSNLSIENNENYAILYNYREALNSNKLAGQINDNGQLEKVYAPVISSGNALHKTTASDETWWNRITQYPIKVTVQLKGLLRPAILMTHVRLHLYFYGRPHIASGLYIITKQVDQIDISGFKTTLSMVRIDGADIQEVL